MPSRVALLREIRSHYPDAFLFCLIQWTGTPSPEPAINQAVATLTGEGDANVEAFDINVSDGANDGCDGHPNLAMQQAMGERLAAEIARVRPGVSLPGLAAQRVPLPVHPALRPGAASSGESTRASQDPVRGPGRRPTVGWRKFLGIRNS